MASNIFVLSDEAHRTQYGGLAANLWKALPNAAFFGFTGTPNDTKDRSTLATFGGYIDTYAIEQAVTDGATLPIHCESRLPDLRILGNTLDAVFDRVFADRSDEERHEIKKKYATEAAVASKVERRFVLILDDHDGTRFTVADPAGEALGEVTREELTEAWEQGARKGVKWAGSIWVRRREPVVVRGSVGTIH